MVTTMEITATQKNKLFMLLTLKVENPTLNIVGLDKYIDATIAGMSQEDVAWVEKLIKEL